MLSNQVKSKSGIYILQLYSCTKVVTMKINEEIPQKDFMQMDMIYVSKLPPNSVLLFEMTRYRGGETNTDTAFIRLEQGQVIDALKLKNGDII